MPGNHSTGWHRDLWKFPQTAVCHLLLYISSRGCRAYIMVYICVIYNELCKCEQRTFSLLSYNPSWSATIGYIISCRTHGLWFLILSHGAPGEWSTAATWFRHFWLHFRLLILVSHIITSSSRKYKHSSRYIHMQHSLMNNIHSIFNIRYLYIR